MNAAVLERVPRERARPQRGEEPHDHDAWACGLPADAGPAERERCRDVVPELIVELL